MTGEQVYVSHAPADLEFAQTLFSTVKNFPFDVHLALEEVDTNAGRGRLTGRIERSDVTVAVLTDRSVTSKWVNQEIGYARAEGVPILPVYDDAGDCEGYVADEDGIAIDRGDATETIFSLLSALRAELAPLGSLSVPNWFIQFPCTSANCGERLTLDIDQPQPKLWKRYRHGQPLSTSCRDCGATYYFNPATIGLVRRVDGAVAE
ncbi:toll/interleukin-1 receptor domain-containing protein [Natrialbaceae archaeon A-arb3/5]